MKYAAVVLAFVALVHAQTRDDIPSCAIPCLDDAITSKTSCAISDTACVCQNFDTIRGAATSCVIDKCGADVALNKVVPATEALCKNAGSGSSAASSAAGTTSAASSAAQSSSAAASSSALASSSAVSSAASSAVSTHASPSSAATATTGAQSSGTAATSAGTTAGSATTAAAGTTSAAVTAGAAAMGSVGGLAMLFLGALAL